MRVRDGAHGLSPSGVAARHIPRLSWMRLAAVGQGAEPVVDPPVAHAGGGHEVGHRDAVLGREGQGGPQDRVRVVLPRASRGRLKAGRLAEGRSVRTRWDISSSAGRVVA